MSWTQRIVGLLDAGVFQHIRAIIGANHDYPYHDFKTIEDGSEPLLYSVGKNNMNAKGTQSKLFVSKSTLILANAECTIRFNDTNNTPITIRPDVCYEFLSNIHMVYVSAIGDGGRIDMAFEGVLPQECRSAE